MALQSSHTVRDREKFDSYASDYVSLHERNIAITGESPEYFAVYKLRCLERFLGPDFDLPVLDYGCGVGMVTQQLSTRFSEVHGFDPSAESVAAARDRAPRARFHTAAEQVPEGYFGLVVMSGVLHHVRPSDREGVLRSAIQTLRPGGRLVVFEHNPLNPLTRRVVRLCPFDDDAILLWPWEALRLVRRAGINDARLRFIVFLPHALAWLRWLEPRLGAVPLGAQVMIAGATRRGDSSVR
jgi:SAM-dependent methyltransferase